MIQFHSLETPQLERFLERHKSGLPFKTDIDLDLVLRQILQKANEFVPSESGSILLDDPFRKVASRHENELVFIATFGDAGRDTVIGPGVFRVDASIIRNFRFGSKYAQFRFEAFNALNNPIWNDPNTTLSSPLYGTINNTRTPMREVQLGLKFVF